MTKKNNQKAKILYLQKFLLEETDLEHNLTVQDLIEKLNSVEIPAERKSIYDDIETLKDFGMEIEVTRSRSNIYNVKERLFSEEELTLLLQAIGQVTELNLVIREQIIAKICSLGSKYQRERLHAIIEQNEYVASEKLSPIELRCNNEILIEVQNYLSDSKIKKSKTETSVLQATIVVDEQFFCWLFQQGSKVKILAPDNLRKEYVKYCKKILNQYK